MFWHHRPSLRFHIIVNNITTVLVLAIARGTQLGRVKIKATLIERLKFQQSPRSLVGSLFACQSWQPQSQEHGLRNISIILRNAWSWLQVNMSLSNNSWRSWSCSSQKVCRTNLRKNKKDHWFNTSLLQWTWLLVCWHRWCMIVMTCKHEPLQQHLKILKL